jgi:hypothetical protein
VSLALVILTSGPRSMEQLSSEMFQVVMEDRRKLMESWTTQIFHREITHVPCVHVLLSRMTILTSKGHKETYMGGLDTADR